MRSFCEANDLIEIFYVFYCMIKQFIIIYFCLADVVFVACISSVFAFTIDFVEVVVIMCMQLNLLADPPLNASKLLRKIHVIFSHGIAVTCNQPY